MSSRTSLIYVITGTTANGAKRRSAHLSLEKARAKQADWMARGWTVEFHRVSSTCIDCQEAL